MEYAASAAPVAYGCIIGKKRPSSNTNTPKGTPAYGAVCGLPSLTIPELTLLMPDYGIVDIKDILTNPDDPSKFMPETNQTIVPEICQINSGTPDKALHDIPEHICSLVWEKYIGSENESSHCYACRIKKINSFFYKCGQLTPASTTIDNLRAVCIGCWFQMKKEGFSLNKYIEQYGLHK